MLFVCVCFGRGGGSWEQIEVLLCSCLCSGAVGGEQRGFFSSLLLLNSLTLCFGRSEDNLSFVSSFARIFGGPCALHGAGQAFHLPPRSTHTHTRTLLCLSRPPAARPPAGTWPLQKLAQVSLMFPVVAWILAVVHRS